MRRNPLLAIDFYKVGHIKQYPEGTTEIYSNFTARYVKECKNVPLDFDNKIVMFGLQYFIKNYLMESWGKDFFDRPKCQVISEYHSIVSSSLSDPNFDSSHIGDLHDLGYLPIRIKAIPEGSLVPIGVPILTIVNTHPKFYWLTNYLETILSASLWKPITSATIAYQFKKLLMKFEEKTSDNSLLEFHIFQSHDFSFRGMSNWEDASISGAAHLTSFVGTDSVSSIELLNNYYDGDSCQIIGCSVPATEHSVMCCGGEDGELPTIERLITEIYPSGVISVVSDSYNFWRTLEEYLPKLRDKIMIRDGKVVIRPDSGDPFKVICGDEDADETTPQRKGALKILWDIFGGKINNKGYKELDSHIGLIYGDAITLDVATSILKRMEEQGFASTNIVFGVGSFTYQYVTRDTFGFAMKATSAVINGKRVPIFKDPIDKRVNKKSAKGLLYVGFDNNKKELILQDDVSEDKETLGHLEVVFENSVITKNHSLFDIRNRLIS